MHKPISDNPRIKTIPESKRRNTKTQKIKHNIIHKQSNPFEIFTSKLEIRCERHTKIHINARIQTKTHTEIDYLIGCEAKGGASITGRSSHSISFSASPETDDEKNLNICRERSGMEMSGQILNVFSSYSVPAMILVNIQQSIQMKPCKRIGEGLPFVFKEIVGDP